MPIDLTISTKDNTILHTHMSRTMLNNIKYNMFQYRTRFKYISFGSLSQHINQPHNLINANSIYGGVAIPEAIYTVENKDNEDNTRIRRSHRKQSTEALCFKCRHDIRFDYNKWIYINQFPFRFTTFRTHVSYCNTL